MFSTYRLNSFVDSPNGPWQNCAQMVRLFAVTWIPISLVTLGKSTDMSQARAQRQDSCGIKQDDDSISKPLLAALENHYHPSNLCLVNLPVNGNEAATITYLQWHLPIWLPSLAGRHAFEIERDNQVYTGHSDAKGNNPHMLIFKLLHFRDRQNILKA